MITSQNASINCRTEKTSYAPYGDVRSKHKLMADAIKPKNYKLQIEQLTKEIVNRSNSYGISEVSQGTLARALRCSDRTVRTYLTILENDNFIHRKKNGWGETSTITLLPIKTKLDHKAEKFSYNLNTPILRDNINNINHYSEYESIFSNSEKKQKTFAKSQESQKSQHPNPDRIMKSEWEVKNDQVPEEFNELLKCKFMPQEQILVSNAIKRLIAPVEIIRTALAEVLEIKKKVRLYNPVGLLVNKVKKMKANQSAKPQNPQKPVDTAARYRLQAQAEELAQKEMAIKGYVDPRLNGIADYEAMRAYDDILATMVNKCLKYLSQGTAQQKEITPKQNWADRAYS